MNNDDVVPPFAEPASQHSSNDTLILMLAKRLAYGYPSLLPSLYVDGEPIGKELVEACKAVKKK